MKLLRHVVLFRFNNQATQEIVGQIERDFASLADKIPAIHSFEWGFIGPYVEDVTVVDYWIK